MPERERGVIKTYIKGCVYQQVKKQGVYKRKSQGIVSVRVNCLEGWHLLKKSTSSPLSFDSAYI